MPLLGSDDVRSDVKHGNGMSVPESVDRTKRARPTEQSMANDNHKCLVRTGHGACDGGCVKRLCTGCEAVYLVP